MTELRSARPSRRAPRIDVVRSMLADRDSRTPAAPSDGASRPSAEDRRKLWQERLAEYVRDPPRA